MFYEAIARKLYLSHSIMYSSTQALPQPNYSDLLQPRFHTRLLLVPLKALLRLVRHVQRVALDEHAAQQRHRRQRTHHHPDRLQAVRVRLHQLRFLRQVVRHGADDLHQARRFLRVLLRVRRQQRVREQLGVDLVLKDDAADGDAERLAEGAEEGEESDGEGDVLVADGGLQTEVHGGEEDAGAEAGDDVEEDPARDGGVDVEEDEQPAAEGGEGPAGPDTPPVPARDGDGDAGGDGGGRDGKGLGEGADAGDDGRVAFDGFVVERQEVDDRPEDHAMDDCLQVCDSGRPVAEDTQSEERLYSNVVFVEHESYQSYTAEDQGEKCLPATPRIHDAAPSEGDHEGCG